MINALSKNSKWLDQQKIVNTSRILDGAFKIINKMKVLIMNVNRFHDKVQLDKNGKWGEAQKIQQEPVIH